MTRVSDWALITGAGSGIGAALARELAGRGTGVVLVGRRQASLDDVRASFVDNSSGIMIEADIASASDRARMESDVSVLLAEQGGHLRYLIHNAGVGVPSLDFELSEIEAIAAADKLTVSYGADTRSVL